MRAIAIVAGTSAPSVSFTVDRDTTLVGFNATKSSALVSDGSLAYTANIGTPTVSGSFNTVFAVAGGNVVPTNLKIPFSAGEVIYLVSSSGSTTAILYFEDPE